MPSAGEILAMCRFLQRKSSILRPPQVSSLRSYSPCRLVNPWTFSDALRPTSHKMVPYATFDPGIAPRHTKGREPDSRADRTSLDIRSPVHCPARSRHLLPIGPLVAPHAIWAPAGQSVCECAHRAKLRQPARSTLCPVSGDRTARANARSPLALFAGPRPIAICSANRRKPWISSS